MIATPWVRTITTRAGRSILVAPRCRPRLPPPHARPHLRGELRERPAPHRPPHLGGEPGLPVLAPEVPHGGELLLGGGRRLGRGGARGVRAHPAPERPGAVGVH